jgi:hypothetical protein
VQLNRFEAKNALSKNLISEVVYDFRNFWLEILIVLRYFAA